MLSGKMSFHSGSDLVNTPELCDKETSSTGRAFGSTTAGTAGKRKWLLLLIFSVSQVSALLTLSFRCRPAMSAHQLTIVSRPV